jgi:hypothetical protein
MSTLFSSLSRRLPLLGAAIAAVALFVGGCATATEAPVERLVTSQATVRAAEEVGAGQSPRAAFHLRLAKEQLAEAKRMINAGKNAEANVMLQRAAADAELSMALTKQVIAMRQAERVKREVASLRNP